MTIFELLALAVKNNASDLHLSANHSPLLRIDGELQPIHNQLDNSTLKTMVYSIMTLDQQEKFSKELDIDFAYCLENNQRFRVNVYQQQHGIGAVFRIICSRMPTLQSLALPAVFKNFCDSSQGLILITGPTGSGKSSSLAALIHEINQTQAKHIVTIEDPIEFVHISQQSLLTQREVQRDTLSFQTALRAALREDPDIICMAELRDLETIRLALTAAETGHLVLATLHTASAAKTLDRLIDVFPGNEKEMVRTMLSESLLAIVSQRLHRRPEGGRFAAFEILIATAAIRHLIRENKTAQIYSAMQTGRSLGMCTFAQYLSP
jgi:twitching motility protein PilT